MGVAVQQNCSGHRRNSPRRDHLRDAGGLLRRVQAGLLDFGPDATAPHTLWPLRTARLFKLASFYARGLADPGTGSGWVALSRSAIGSDYLFFDADDGEPRAHPQANQLSEKRLAVVANPDWDMLPIRMCRLRCCDFYS